MSPRMMADHMPDYLTAVLRRMAHRSSDAGAAARGGACDDAPDQATVVPEPGSPAELAAELARPSGFSGGGAGRKSSGDGARGGDGEREAGRDVEQGL